MSATITLSPLEQAARRLAAATAGGALFGLLIGGVGGRLAMFLLIKLSPKAEGLVSDDGFVMGQFTYSGSLNLLAAGTFLGVIGGAVYFVLRGLMIGPRWFQVLSIAGGAAVVVGSMLVHTDGLDFKVLHPPLLAIALFVVIPGIHAALLTVLVERWIAPDGVFARASNRVVFLPLLLGIPLAPLFLAIAVVWAVAMRLRRIASVRDFLTRPWLPWIARLALAVVFVIAGAGLVNDTLDLV